MITREPYGVTWTDASSLAGVAQHAPVGSRPFVHPIRTVAGRVVTENAPAHHPWQHGLYFGLNGVNYIGFWTEGLLAGRPRDGRVVATACDFDADGWRVASDWHSPEGDVLLTDAQQWACCQADGLLRIDVRWTLRANIAVTLAAYPYGGLFLRMPYRPDAGASVLNSAGATTIDAVEGARASWVCVGMTVEDGPVSVAILDHPANPDHPTPWRADPEFGVGPAMQRTGPRSLKAGESLQYRYRVLVADGTLAADRITPALESFAGDLL